MGIRKKILILLIIIFPNISLANISITEVAWMGNSSSANDEWIELHNSGSSSVNLDGWSLSASDGSPSISLSGNIASGAYALLERTDDSSEPGINALVIYTGALSNGGENLVLKNASNAIVQSLDFSSGWPAGDSSTKDTMQWNGSGWVTGSATPGSGFSGSSVPIEDTDDEEDAINSEDDNGTDKLVKKKRYSDILVEIDTKSTSVLVGNPVRFYPKTRDEYGDNIFKGTFVWNMGDGRVEYFDSPDDFTHTYEHEGSYVVVLNYYRTSFYHGEPDKTDRYIIDVKPVSVYVSGVKSDGSIELKNESSKEVNLDSWVLKNEKGQIFVIPRGTIILPNKTLILSAKRTGMNGVTANIFNPSGDMIMNIAPVSGQRSSYNKIVSSSKVTSSQKTTQEKTIDKAIDLNEKMEANTLSAQTKRQPINIWVAVFFFIVIVSSVVVFLVFRKREENITEEGFELID